MSSSTTPPGPPPGAPSGPPPASGPRPVDWVGLVRTGWLDALRVAGGILGVSLVLAVLIGLGLRPGIPGLHWTLRTTLVFFGWLWTSAFGADLTGHASVAGMHADAGVGTFALTITILALGAGVLLFRRATAGVPSAVGVAWFALQTAVLTAIPPLVVSWVLYADQASLVHLAGHAPTDLGGVAVLGGVNLHLSGLRVGLSAVGSFFLTLVLTLVTLLAAAVTRRGLLTGRAERIRGILAGPVVGTGVLLVALVPLGLLAALLIWLFRLGQPGTTGLTWHEWMNLVAAAIAYAPNLALWQLGLGSAGRIHAAASTSLASASASTDKGLGYWAGNDVVNHGMWFAVVLAPALLALTAYAVVRSARRHGVAPLAPLAAWVVSLLIVLPFLFHFAGIHGHATASGVQRLLSGLGGMASLLLGASRLPDTVTGSVSVGPTTLTVLLVFVYAAIVATLVALATRVVTRDSLAGLRGARGRTTLTDTTLIRGGATGPYQPGDVVNGWRWTGTEWVPAASD